MIAELLCAWVAGIMLGWRLGLVHRRTNAELAYWAVITAECQPPFDWADEENSSKHTETGTANG